MNTPDKILVLRFSSIGDVVLSTPLLRCLRTAFPRSQIDYAIRTEYAELVKFNQNINFTYELDAGKGLPALRALKKKVRSERYDLLVDIHGSLRSRYLRAFSGADHIVTVNKRIKERAILVRTKKDLYGEPVSVSRRYIETVERFGVRDDGKGPELHIPDEILFGAAGRTAALKLHRFEKVIGLCPAARHATKRWPKDRFVELGIRLALASDAKILLFGGTTDVAGCESIATDIGAKAGRERVTNFSGQLSLLQTAAVMDSCDLVITNDTGLMHMAEARQRHLVAIFGSTVRQFGFFPQGKNSFVVENENLYCRPCSSIGRSSCPEGHFRCMNEITVDRVFERATSLVTGKT